MRHVSSLSVCMSAGRDPAAVRAILGLLRPLADEIVLAADSRRAEEILGACGDLVDRPLVFDYEPTPSRYKGWLHHQCTADWILQLDDDEVPSRGLLDTLPELVADRRLSRVDLPVRELYPDTDHYLTSHPWSPAYRVRLVRNVSGLWSFDGSAHGEPQVLGEGRRASEAPLYHLHHATESLEQRHATARLSERLRPGRVTEAYPVNALYLPEYWSGVQTAPVPEPDRGLIAAVADPAPAPVGAAPEPLARVTAAEADAFNAVDRLPDDAYRAELTISTARRRLFAGTVAHLEVTARNLGSAHWPPAHRTRPLIRLAYRWLDASTETVLVAEGLRTPFEETVLPGAQTIVMLAVEVPERTGRYVLEVDIVHELVRWFGCAARLEVDVEPLHAPPDGLGLARPDMARIPLTG